jgi:small-conductance mechanosensitive channel
MTNLTILAVVTVAVCVLCGVIALVAYKRAADAKDFSQRTLNTANEIVQRNGDENRALRVALNALNEIVKNLKEENRAIRDELEKVRNLIPEDVKEERLRRDVLMSQLNDELETRVKAEQEWNAMVAGILGYDINKAKAAGVKADE